MHEEFCKCHSCGLESNLKFPLASVPSRETELYAKREEVWQQIEELARKKNPQFESLINQMDYLSMSQNSMNDHTVNEDDFSSDAIDHYSKDVSLLAIL